MIKERSKVLANQAKSAKFGKKKPSNERSSENDIEESSKSD